MHLTVKQVVNWSSVTSTARSAMVPEGLLRGAGLDLSGWVNSGCPGEIQAAADEEVCRLIGGTLRRRMSTWLPAALRVRTAPLKRLSTASQKQLKRGFLCRRCHHLK